MSDLKIAIIIGSTRPGRNGKQVADWIATQAADRDASYELIDIEDFNLPLLDEPTPAGAGPEHYTQEHTKAWSAAIAPFDAYVIVTPEYNHGVNAALKNALDFLYQEWNNKPASFVGYGSLGGARAIEHLRGIVAQLGMASVPNTVTFSLMTEFPDGTFTPADYQLPSVEALFEQTEAWATALKTLR